MVSRARWITYLDDDDVLLPDMAEKVMEAIRQIPQDLPAPVALLFGLNITDSTRTGAKNPPAANATQRISLLFRRSSARRVVFFQANLGRRTRYAARDRRV